MLAHGVERDREVVTDQQAGHGQRTSQHPGVDVILVRQYEAVELHMMGDHERIGPVDLTEDVR